MSNVTIYRGERAGEARIVLRVEVPEGRVEVTLTLEAFAMALTGLAHAPATDPRWSPRKSP